MSLLDISKTPGPNAGGLKKLYVCLVSDVLAIPAKTAGTLKVTTDITNKTGKKFITWYFTPDTGKLSITSPGERDAKSAESMAEFFLPGMDPDKDLEFSKLLNDDVIILVKDNNNRLRIIGDLDRGATIDSQEGTTGGAMPEKNGTTIKFKYNSPEVPYYYTGAVPLTAAE